MGLHRPRRKLLHLKFSLKNCCPFSTSNLFEGFSLTISNNFFLFSLFTKEGLENSFNTVAIEMSNKLNCSKPW